MNDAERMEGDELEQEAHRIERLFNDAIPEYSREVEWFGMGHDRDRDQEQFVFEATGYLDDDGLKALREAGRTIRYIEAYEYDGEVFVQFNLDVTGDIPTTDIDRSAEAE